MASSSSADGAGAGASAILAAVLRLLQQLASAGAKCSVVMLTSGCYGETASSPHPGQYGVWGLARSARFELHPRGVKITCVDSDALGELRALSPLLLVDGTHWSAKSRLVNALLRSAEGSSDVSRNPLQDAPGEVTPTHKI